jgi:holo-ACP synthase/triphosphoribosyl-dephospho-CoA synthase
MKSGGYPLKSDEVSLEEILAARDRRAHRQKELLSLYPDTLVYLTLNIPGPVKQLPLSEETFHEGKMRIRKQLKVHNVQILGERHYEAKSGNEAFLSVHGDPVQIKSWMTAIEEEDPLGRLFDIDVLDPQGNKISRSQIGMETRRCLLCGNPAPVCARSRAHTLDALVREVERIMCEYFSARMSASVMQAAVRALLYEVSVTPKPGLVDRANSGAHDDMDFFTMTDSIVALAPHFAAFARTGYEWNGSLPELFSKIRSTGVRAEHDMFSATHGINTHKGAIFSLGILCASIGYLSGHRQKASIDAILETAGTMAADVMKDFRDIDTGSAKTHGEKLYAFYGITGIRGEAANGFPNVRRYALPKLKKLLAEGVSLNDAGAVVLLNLLAYVEDTNIITRSDPETGRKVQQMVSRKISENIDVAGLLQYAWELDCYFVKNRLSPGGCADLLAISFFLYFWEQGWKRAEDQV